MILLLCVFAAGWITANITASQILSEKGGKAFLVEINRISQDISADMSMSAGNSVSAGKSVEEYSLAPYKYVTKLSFMPADASSGEINAFFSGSQVLTGMNYLVKPVFEGAAMEGYVRYEYAAASMYTYQYVFFIINGAFAAAFLFAVLLLFYIRYKILQPFNEVQDLPFELSKGRLKKGLKENKNRFFGRFVWGLDLLRESIETQKRKELALEKEKKTMILSVSHGIKTPLSAIMLYSRALYDNLYDSEEKRIETAHAISDNAMQIEKLIGEIVQAQTSDLVDIEVIAGEFYLRDLVNKIQSTYREKLALIHTDFIVAPFSNLLLKGDQQRLMDVFENLIENAVKYGDGREISLSFTKEDNCQLISVENTGTPVSRLESMHVFESFWRGSNAHDKPGNGLGLYICRYICKKMSGDIFISKSDVGMCFTVVVPIA